MATYEIVVTDVTCYGNLYCVAGWDRLSNRMVRPEPPGANSRDEASRFWSSQYAGPGRTFAVGNVVRLEANDPLPGFMFPHATEDRIVDMRSPMQVLETLSPTAMVQAVAAGTASSLPLAFDNALVRVNSKAYDVHDLLYPSPFDPVEEQFCACFGEPNRRNPEAVQLLSPRSIRVPGWTVAGG